ncbi:MAG: hypothetical protein ACOC53_08340, partial [Candidatus Saliniplasma sp.]
MKAKNERKGKIGFEIGLNQSRKAGSVFLVVFVATILLLSVLIPLTTETTVRGTSDTLEVDLTFAGGSGTESDPYQISNVTELQNMSDDLTAHYELISDIDASETENWNGGDSFD